MKNSNQSSFTMSEIFDENVSQEPGLPKGKGTFKGNMLVR